MNFHLLNGMLGIPDSQLYHFSWTYKAYFFFGAGGSSPGGSIPFTGLNIHDDRTLYILVIISFSILCHLKRSLYLIDNMKDIVRFFKFNSV